MIRYRRKRRYEREQEQMLQAREMLISQVIMRTEAGEQVWTSRELPAGSRVLSWPDRTTTLSRPTTLYSTQLDGRTVSVANTPYFTCWIDGIEHLVGQDTAPRLRAAAHSIDTVE